ncbi:MAG: methionyl-tRNA formyltransferase, partial [bacterium]|nr:methionyl-tRNA formyltransferase [bacterium]
MNKKDIEVIFMGTSDFAKEILKSLIDDEYAIKAVFTQPDKKAGRKREIKPNLIKDFSKLNNIPTFQPDKLNSEAISIIKKIAPDLIIVAAYGKIIPKAILEIPKFKCINVHPSLLPKFRGPSPIQNAILAGEKETGITIILMDEKVDHGAILAQEKIAISPEDTTETLTQKMISKSSDLLLQTIPRWIQGEIKEQKQDDSLAAYCKLIEREDGKISWNEEARTIYNKHRAFQPWPGIFCFMEIKGKTTRIKLNKITVAEIESETKHCIGEVFRQDNRIAVRTAKEAIIIEEIQIEGKKSIGINEFIKGYS